MISPVIRYFHSPDVDDLRTYRPAAGADYSLLVQMMIGPQGADGEEAFDIQIVTPGWLRTRSGSTGFASGEARLIVFDYNWVEIEQHLRDRVSLCGGRDWFDVASKIARFARWEFEGYKPLA
jgi:hypothetical protein